MITKEQAMTADNFIQLAEMLGERKLNALNFTTIFIPSGEIKSLDNGIKWRRNGATKVWKTRPDEFKIPVKHGLRDYGYITNENAHLFEAVL